MRVVGEQSWLSPAFLIGPIRRVAELESTIEEIKGASVATLIELGSGVLEEPARFAYWTADIASLALMQVNQDCPPVLFGRAPIFVVPHENAKT